MPYLYASLNYFYLCDRNKITRIDLNGNREKIELPEHSYVLDVADRYIAYYHEIAQTKRIHVLDLKREEDIEIDTSPLSFHFDRSGTMLAFKVLHGVYRSAPYVFIPSRREIYYFTGDTKYNVAYGRVITYGGGFGIGVIDRDGRETRIECHNVDEVIPDWDGDRLMVLHYFIRGMPRLGVIINGEERYAIRENIESAGITPDGKHLVHGNERKTTITNLDTGERITVPLPSHGNWLRWRRYLLDITDNDLVALDNVVYSIREKRVLKRFKGNIAVFGKFVVSEASVFTPEMMLDRTPGDT